jgi:hypothetical protein
MEMGAIAASIWSHLRAVLACWRLSRDSSVRGSFRWDYANRQFEVKRLSHQIDILTPFKGPRI